MGEDTAHRFEGPELERCVAAMAAGDRAFIVTFATRFGAAVRAAAAERGVDPRRVAGADGSDGTAGDRLVADVAVEVFDRAAGWSGSARELVEDVVDDVVSGPEGVAGGPVASCGGGIADRGEARRPTAVPRRRVVPAPGDGPCVTVLPDEVRLPLYRRDWTQRPALRAA